MTKPVKKDATATKKDATTTKKPAHNTTKDLDTRPSYWDERNVAYLLDQLTTHHGVRFDTSNMKEYKKQITKANLLKLIKEKLKI